MRRQRGESMSIGVYGGLQCDGPLPRLALKIYSIGCVEDFPRLAWAGRQHLRFAVRL